MQTILETLEQIGPLLSALTTGWLELTFVDEIRVRNKKRGDLIGPLFTLESFLNIIEAVHIGGKIMLDTWGQYFFLRYKVIMY
jgi:hypothetical protein